MRNLKYALIQAIQVVFGRSLGKITFYRIVEPLGDSFPVINGRFAF